MRLSTPLAAELRLAGLDPDDVVAVIGRGSAEDLGAAGDVTSTATIAAGTVIAAQYVARAPGVAAGMPVLAAVIEGCLGESVRLERWVTDGARLAAGDVLGTVEGDARGVLSIERLSLNLLGHLCGVATVTRTWVEAVAGTAARIRDTRKTTPGLRDLEKYAVRCGGGVNHRRGLDSGVLIKDNHVAAAGGVGPALEQVAAMYPDPPWPVQVEVDDLAQLDDALHHGADQILLDNFTVPELAEAVARTRAVSPETVLEASGGLRLEIAAEVAATGVNFLAVGALTHSAPSLDIGLDVTPG